MESYSYLLTDQERERFAWWLESQAYSSLEIANQMDKIGVGALSERNKVEAAAYTTVAKILRSTEAMTIS